MQLTEEKKAEIEHKEIEKEHLSKLNELYKKYYDMAMKGNVQAFNAFVAFSKDYIKDSSEEGELERILNKVKIGKDVDDARIDAAWNSFLVSIPTYKLDLLLALRKDYVVYLLSNTNEIHWKWSCEHAFPYKTFRVEDYFEHIFLSYEMKMAKPDEEIFRKVLDDAGLDPKETFFIDDSEANCMTARSLGISTYVPKAGEDWSHLFK